VITLLESKVKIGMDLRELRLLRRGLALVPTNDVLHSSGWTLGQIQTFREIQNAFEDYAAGLDPIVSREDTAP
jgi:hypothetical protein